MLQGGSCFVYGRVCQRLRVDSMMDSWKDQLGRLQSSVGYELVEKDFCSYIDKNILID